MSEYTTYLQVLREIDLLREKGVGDSDQRMMKLRIELRDHLEIINKTKPKSVVPTLLSVNTIKIPQRSKKRLSILAKPSIWPKTRNVSNEELADKTHTLDGKKDNPTTHYTLGAAIAVIAVIAVAFNFLTGPNPGDTR